MAAGAPETVAEFGRELVRLFETEGPVAAVNYAKQHLPAMRPLMTPGERLSICDGILDLANRLAAGEPALAEDEPADAA